MKRVSEELIVFLLQARLRNDTSRPRDVAAVALTVSATMPGATMPVKRGSFASAISARPLEACFCACPRASARSTATVATGKSRVSEIELALGGLCADRVIVLSLASVSPPSAHWGHPVQHRSIVLLGQTSATCQYSNHLKGPPTYRAQ
jgi:hypothetical protein